MFLHTLSITMHEMFSTQYPESHKYYIRNILGIYIYGVPCSSYLGKHFNWVLVGDEIKATKFIKYIQAENIHNLRGGSYISMTV